MAVNFYACPATEGHMERLGLKFKLNKQFPIDQDQLAKSLVNRPRFDKPLDKERALAIAIAAEEGCPLPPMVAKADRYLLDGVHREYALLELGAKTAWAYQLNGSADERAMELFSLSVNQLNGEPLSEDACVEWAWQWHQSEGATSTELAPYIQKKPQWLSRRFAARELQEWLAQQGVRIDNLPSWSVLDKLGPLRKSEPVLIAVARLAVSHKLPGDRVKDIVKKVKSRRTEATQLAAVDDFRSELEAEAPKEIGHVKLNYRTKFLRHITTLEKFLAEGRRGRSFNNAAQLQLTEEERLACRKRINKLHKMLGATLK